MCLSLYLVCLSSYSVILSVFFFFVKQTPAYEMRISDCSSYVCSSDLLGRDRGVVHALVRVARHLVALIGQFEADADAAEIIAQLTAKGFSGLGVELRVEAIVRLGPCVDDGEIGIVEVSNAGAKLEIHTLVGFILRESRRSKSGRRKNGASNNLLH